MTTPLQDQTARDCSLELAALPSAVPLARAYALCTLQKWQVAPGIIESAVLVVSELATNVVPKTLLGGQLTYAELDGVRLFWLRLRIRHDGAGLLIEVRDSNSKPPLVRNATPRDEGGRGLFIVRTLSRDWGYYYFGTFKVVWSEMDCALAA